MPEVATTLLVNRAVITENDEVLLLRRSFDDSRNPGLWEFPGGKIDAGEGPDEGLVREVFEETGLSIRVSSNITHMESHPIESGKYSGRLYVSLFRMAQNLGGNLTLSNEHCDARWVAPGRIAINELLTRESGRALKSFREIGII